MGNSIITLDDLLARNRYVAHYKPDAYSEVMTPVFEALHPSGALVSHYARLKLWLEERSELRSVLEAARVDDPLASLPIFITEEDEILTLTPVWRALAHRARDFLRALYKGTPEALAELPPDRQRASKTFIHELEGKVPASEKFEIYLPVQLSRTQTDKGRIEWTLYALSNEDDEICFLKSLSYANVARAFEPFFEGASHEPGYTAAHAPDLAAFVGYIRRLHDAPPEAPVLFIGSKERESVYSALGVGKLGATGFASTEVTLAQKTMVVTFLHWEKLPEAVRTAYLKGEISIWPFVGTYLFRGFNEYEVLRVLWDFHARSRAEVTAAIEAEGVACPAIDHDFTNYLRVRVPKIARLDATAGTEGNGQDEYHNVFSQDKRYFGLYDKPLVRMSAILSDEDGPILEGPRATPEQVRNCRLRVQKGLASYSVIQDFVPKMQVNRNEVHWIRPLTGGDERRRFELSGHFRARSMPKGSSYGAPEDAKAFDLPPAFVPRASHVDLWELEVLGKLSCTEAKKVEALFSLEGALRRGLGVPAGATARNVLDALAGKSFSCDFRVLARFLAERLGKEARARALLERVRRAEALYDDARSHTAATTRWGAANPPSCYDRIDQAEYRKFYEEYDTTVAGERDAVFFDGSGKKTRFKRKNNAQRTNQLGEIVDWLHSYYRHLGYPEERIERHRFRWEGREHENLIITIPGTERPDEWVFLGDHYDTAFEADVFDASGRRVSAAGADDNATAVAAVMLAGRVLKDIRPKRSIRLVHLTGEEFPADCLGTRRLCSKLVEDQANVQGVYIMDMIGFDRSNGLFQVSPGRGERALALALDVLASTALWNRGGHGLELRPDLRLAAASVDSSLYNTDGQIYSDAGFPCVLFMEDYDIARTGYHDTHDTNRLITWPYACAIAQVATDSALRTASR